MKKQTTIKTAGILATISLTAVFSGCMFGITTDYYLSPAHDASGKEKGAFSSMKETDADKCVANKLEQEYDGIMVSHDLDYQDVSEERFVNAKSQCKTAWGELSRYKEIPKVAVEKHKHLAVRQMSGGPLFGVGAP